ncbi:hypothetical protein ACHAWU_006878 [Discostella pseudostelligera]|uniref:PWI domain-containing protein n=1 Tax=Discostella pseudostelligera TaxID=259834 RepID=A0ABD3MYI8_9STRA
MPSIKGTASITSTSALQKQLRSTTFPSNFSQKVNIAKVHRTVFTHWIEKRIEQILGFEDDIVSSTAVHLFLPSSGDNNDATAPAVDYWDVDPRRAQLDLAGFLGEGEAATFASELWTMMLDAQTSPSGIPRVLVEKKKEEMRLQREEMDRKRLQQQQQQQARRGGGGANYHLDGVGDTNNNNGMNAFVREAARRAEAARAVILPGAGAAGSAGGAAAAGPGGHPAAAVAVPAAANAANSGPVPVPPSPSPPRHYGGGRGGFGGGGGGGARGDYDYDRRGGRYNRGGGAGGGNYYDQRRNNNGGGRNYDAYYNNRRDYDYDDGYHRRDDYYIDRRGERGEDGGSGRGGGRWEDLDEFGRGRRDELLGGGNNHPTDRSRQPLDIGKSGGGESGSGAAIKGGEGGGGHKDNKLEARKEPSSKETENDKASQQPSLGRVDAQTGVVGKDDGVKPTRKRSAT